MIGEVRFLLLRLPRSVRRAINRASLPKLGVPRADFAVTITKDLWNSIDFDVAKGIAPEASLAMRFQDEASFGAPELWLPWSEFRKNRGVMWTADDKTIARMGMIEFVFTRAPIKFAGPGGITLRERVAAFIVNRWGLL